MTETPVYDRYALAKGMCISGPAIIEERESTLIIGSGATAAADERWNLILTYD
jgi:N-methylhydantoinase A